MEPVLISDYHLNKLKGEAFTSRVDQNILVFRHLVSREMIGIFSHKILSHAAFFLLGSQFYNLVKEAVIT